MRHLRLVLSLTKLVFGLPSHRRHLARTRDEGALAKCVEDEGEARGVEGVCPPGRLQDVIGLVGRSTGAESHLRLQRTGHRPGTLIG